MNLEAFEAFFKVDPHKKTGIGVEHEKILFHSDATLLEYDAHVKGLLNLIASKFEGSLDFYGNNPIGWKKEQISITLEPGSQFELNGSLHFDLKSLKVEFQEHVNFLKYLEREAGVYGSCLGMNPFYNNKQIPLLPKKRYGIMYPYMKKVGNYGQDMMKRSATIQANIDFLDAEDFKRKFQASMFISPLFAALLSNSPFYEGEFNGNLSNRLKAWQSTDPERCGLLDFVYNGEFTTSKYISWSMKAKNYFDYLSIEVKEDLVKSFEDFLMENKDLPESELLKHYETHLSTLFPEVRAKKFLELRSFDLNHWDLCLAISSFCYLSLYDKENLDEILRIQSEIKLSDFEKFYAEMPSKGLNTKIGKNRAYELIREIFGKVFNKASETEKSYLEPMSILIETKKSPADYLIEKYKTGKIRNKANFVKENAFTKTFKETYFK